MTRNAETKGSYVVSFIQSPIRYVFVNFHGHDKDHGHDLGHNGKILGMILGKRGKIFGRRGKILMQEYDYAKILG